MLAFDLGRAAGSHELEHTAHRVALVKQFERWGMAQQLQGRLVQAPPGVPVGALVARGEVALGFQQLSELMNLEGIDVIGLMPEPVQITTTFSAGICASSSHTSEVRRMFEFLSSPQAAEAKRRSGMEPA